jgi:hypothetical protein
VNVHAVMYAPASTGGGALWAYSGGSAFDTELSGTIGGISNSAGVIYTATYPS